ncbi:unnamed protein product [Danaus chrysippus]|uniref:(African queen) hypothetical protein n=1 Tax=Danaus chrysippus TaxID=151541 RepID=A0A8J2W2Z8_9NEOP|nr:unnamed protein product [Danaus chrysippus]
MPHPMYQSAPLEKAAKGLYLKERSVPPEVLGRLYAEYCDVINRMYDSYLNSVQLQRAPFILEIVSIVMKRLYELKNELVHIIVNDYIYVDDALITAKKTPFDIQIVVPYHFPLESREDSIEQLLQRMWADAEWRKLHPETSDINEEDDVVEDAVPVISEVKELIQKESSIILSEDFIQAVIILKHERFRQFFMEDFRAKCSRRRLYFSENIEEARLEIKIKAALLIQKVYRMYMEIKRKRVSDIKRDILLGLIPDPFKKKLSLEEENNKMYERKHKIRQKCHEIYLEELKKEKMRLIVYKKEDQIDDITDHVRSWFLEWYYGYGFFPDYPYESEGGTMMVVKGNYPTIAEKLKEDEEYANAMKGKTKEQLKAEMKQAKADALLKEAAAKEAKKREEEQLFKLRLNPLSDPGYKPKPSEVTGQLGEALQKYRAAWSIYDKFSPEECPRTIYGFMQNILTEELMCQLHEECRKYVDELMRLDLKLLIKVQQEMFKSVGWHYPKMKPRKKPKSTPVPKSLKLNDDLLDSLKTIFDLGIITKPTAKVKDIIGDFKYAAYEMNIKDPDATFPSPGFADVKRRLILSCVFGSGIEPGAVRNKSVMLLGPERNGKSFMVDTICGELNAVKIDITPEVFSAVVDKPAKVLAEVVLAAKIFQPSVIYMKNIERVFYKKVPPEERALQAKVLKAPMTKMMKQILPEDKIIFVATCSNPFVAQTKPMMFLFNETILIPRTDYNSLRTFFYERFQKIRSMPRDYCVQALAQVLQGYGFGVILQLFDKVMTAERIVRLNITPLAPAEFLPPLFDMMVEAVTLEEYQEYVQFFIENSPLSKEREDFEFINRYRAVAYTKLEKEKKK